MKYSRRKGRASNRKTSKRRGGDGIFDFLFAANYLRKVYYVDWLEERLAIHYKDLDWLTEIRKKFAYNKTNLLSFPESAYNKYCGRDAENKNLIAPNMANKCPLTLENVMGPNYKMPERQRSPPSNK